MRYGANWILWVALLAPAAGAQQQGAEDGVDSSATPKQQYDTLEKEFSEAARVSYLPGASDAEKKAAIERITSLPERFLALAEDYPSDPIALDALVQAINEELYLESNTLHPGFGKNSREVKALAILIRDHVESDRLGEACRRVRYGFRGECEAFLRAVLEKNPHHDVQALACLRLAQFLNGRLRRLDLINEQPETIRRYEGLFGRDYMDELARQDRDEALAEIEAIFERSAKQYGDVIVPYGGTVAEIARSELQEIRNLALGKVAPEIEGQDQDGAAFRLSDYRGKVVLLYFWSQY